MTTSPSAQVVDAEHPWLGLSPFTEATKSFFFGRDQEVRDIFLRVREQPLTVLYGQSGLGKTSLLGAGLIPKLKVEEFRPAIVRLGYEPTDPPLIEQVFQAIETSRQQTETRGPRPASLSRGSTLWETFQHLPTRAPELLQFPTVLIFDQFEEIFTLTQTRDRQREAEALFYQLADLVENRPPQDVQERLLSDRRLAREYDLTTSSARIVITLREDYLSQLEVWKKLMPALMRNRMALNLLNGPQALEAVVRPGRLAGRELVSEAVGTRIVCFVARRPPDTPLTEIGAVPPLLSLLCDELNATRLATGAATITGDQVDQQSADILQNFYRRSFEGLHPAVRRFVEDRMVTVGGHRNPVAREDALSDLTKAGVPNPALSIDQLIQGRLLSTEDRGGLQRLEITHDVLAPLAVRSRDERQVREAKEQADRNAADHRRRLRRARAALTLYGALALVSTIAGLWAWRAQGIASTAQQLAESREREAVNSKEELTQQLYDNSIAIAEREITRNDDVVKASRLLEDCPVHLRGWEWHYLMRLRDGGRLPLKGHRTGLWQCEFSPDGSRIATCSIDGTLKIWDALSGELIRSIDADHIIGISSLLSTIGIPRIPIMCLAFSPDGSQIATGSLLPQPKFTALEPFVPKPDRDSPGLVRIWDVASGTLVSGFQDQKGVTLAVTYSPDGQRIASSSINPDHSFVVWDVQTRQVVKRVQGHRSHVHRLRFSPDGRILAASDTDGVVKLWNAVTFEELRSVKAHPAPVVGLSFSPDGLRFGTAAEDGLVRVWECETGKLLLDLEGHAGAALDVRFSPDGNRIASSGTDKTIRLWDAVDGKPKLTLRGHEELVWNIAFSPDGQQLVSASFDSTARIWDATPRKDRSAIGEFALSGHSERVNSVALSADGQNLVSGSWDQSLILWDAGTGRQISRLKGHQGAIWCVTFSSDGRHVASACWDHTARVWDRQTGKLVSTFAEHSAPVHCVAFSPDGTRVASGGFDGMLKIWDTISGKVVASCDGFIFPVYTVAFSPDGEHVASGGSDRSVKIWNAKTGKLLRALKNHNASIHCVAFSPDGTRIASASWDRTVRVWDVSRLGDASRNRELLVFAGHVDRVNGVAYSPDGRTIASGSEDKTVRLWDAKTGHEVMLPLLHRAFVWSVAFTKDGQRLISASWDESKWIRAWNISPNPRP